MDISIDIKSLDGTKIAVGDHDSKVILFQRILKADWGAPIDQPDKEYGFQVNIYNDGDIEFILKTGNNEIETSAQVTSWKNWLRRGEATNPAVPDR